MSLKHERLKTGSFQRKHWNEMGDFNDEIIKQYDLSHKINNGSIIKLNLRIFHTQT